MELVLNLKRLRFLGPSLLFMTIFLASCAGGPSKAEGPEEFKPKSPVVGELLAIFPGIIVHGMGHRYAGNTDRANEILTMEAYSLAVVGLGAGLWAIGDSQDADAVRIAGYVGMGVGGIPFIGTWIYDLIYTPSEVERYNLRGGKGE
jgi:hypothetical protein